jgi:MFS family permease
MFYGALGLVFGRLADRRNRRNMILGGMILWSLATIGCGLARNFHELFIGRMLVGVGEAVLNPCAYSMIYDYFSKQRRSRAAAIYTTGAFLGGAGSFVFGGALVDLTAHWAGFTLPIVGNIGGWHAIFVFVGLPGLLVAILMLFVKEPVRREPSGSPARLADLFAYLRQNAKPVALIVIGFSMCGMSNIGLMSWVPTLFIRVFAWSAGQIGVAFGLIIMVAGVTGASAGGLWVSRRSVADSRFVVLRTARAAFLAMPLLLLLVGLSSNPTIVLVALGCLIFLGALVAGLAPVAVYEIAPHPLRAQLVSMYLMCGTVIPYGIGVLLIAAATDYLFRNDLAVGKSLALVLVCGSLLGAVLLNAAIKDRMQWPQKS